MIHFLSNFSRRVIIFFQRRFVTKIHTLIFCFFLTIRIACVCRHNSNAQFEEIILKFSAQLARDHFVVICLRFYLHNFQQKKKKSFSWCFV